MYIYNTQQYYPQLETINTNNNELYIDSTNIVCINNDSTNNNEKHIYKYKYKCKHKYNHEFPNLNLIGCIFFVILFLWVLFLILYIKHKS